MKHKPSSPLPWAVNETQPLTITDGEFMTVGFLGGPARTPEQSAADMAFVIQAVNSHAGLVAALKALRWNIDVSNINNSKRSVKRWEELIDQADAELAKLT